MEDRETNDVKEIDISENISQQTTLETIEEKPKSDMENHIAKFCPNCGAKLVESQKFCPKCGTCVAQEFAEQNLTVQESPERAPQPINQLPLKQPSSFKEEIKNKKKKKKLAKIIVPIVVVVF